MLPKTQSRIRTIRWASPACLALFCFLVAGCSQPEQIRVYRVAKEDSRRGQTPAKVTVAKEQRMLGAIVPHEGMTWFFKLVGEPSQIGGVETAFRDVILSVTFSGAGQATWKLPDGWSQEIVQGITYAKLKPADSDLEATVTTFATQGESWTGWVEDNVNRWRKQLALAEQPWDLMEPGLTELSTLNEGSDVAYFVDLRGTGSGSMGGAPFMNRAIQTPPATAQPQVQDGVKNLLYSVPAGWEETAAENIRLASFSIAGETEP
ncbi:MAG: hypothetical protein KDB22_21840, partial [Planctomycetales bacterium]|nr:hypothetical protein [Planctomycetales bacterium]